MDARGQSETIGVVLLLGITVIGVAVVVAAAGGALDTAQDQSAVQRAEQSMSLFDARSALVALGRSEGQSVSMARSEGGTYSVQPDTGRIVVAKTTNNSTTEFVNRTLGSVVFERGNAEVAYQGGGVWRSVGEGSEMVSPPEFNYQDATLTLPIIVVSGGPDTAAGGPSARVQPESIADPIFPNETRSNPLSNGNVTVSIQSEYYRGWASFFRQRTSGNITLDSDNQTVELELIARGTGGGFTLEETPLELRGLGDDEPIDDLTFTLEPNKNSDFSDLDWSLVADNGGTERFEVTVQGADVCDTGAQPDVTIEYTTGGTTYAWENEDTEFTTNGSTYSYSCDADNDPTMYLNLTGPSNLTYQGASAPIANNSTGYIVEHYIAKMGPNVDLKVLSKGKQNAPGNSGSTDLAASSGNIEYSSSGSRVVTFLHITENTIDVSLN